MPIFVNPLFLLLVRRYGGRLCCLASVWLAYAGLRWTLYAPFGRRCSRFCVVLGRKAVVFVCGVRLTISVVLVADSAVGTNHVMGEKMDSWHPLEPQYVGLRFRQMMRSYVDAVIARNRPRPKCSHHPASSTSSEMGSGKITCVYGGGRGQQHSLEDAADFPLVQNFPGELVERQLTAVSL